MSGPSFRQQRGSFFYYRICHFNQAGDPMMATKRWDPHQELDTSFKNDNFCLHSVIKNTFLCLNDYRLPNFRKSYATVYVWPFGGRRLWKPDVLWHQHTETSDSMSQHVFQNIYVLVNFGLQIWLGGFINPAMLFGMDSWHPSHVRWRLQNRLQKQSNPTRLNICESKCPPMTF